MWGSLLLSPSLPYFPADMSGSHVDHTNNISSLKHVLSTNTLLRKKARHVPFPSQETQQKDEEREKKKLKTFLAHL